MSINYGPRIRDKRIHTSNRLHRLVTQRELANRITEMRPGRRPVIFHSDMSKLESPRYGCGVEMYEEACAALESIVADARSRNMLY